MNRTFIAGVVAGLALAAITLVILPDGTSAAPFNAVTTSRADLGRIDHWCFDRSVFSDAGFEASLDVQYQEQKETTLPDAGLEVLTQATQVRFILPVSAQLTTIVNFTDGNLLTRTRQRLNREQ